MICLYPLIHHGNFVYVSQTIAVLVLMSSCVIGFVIGRASATGSHK